MHWVTQPGPVGSMLWHGPLEENKWGEPACGAGVRGRKMIGGEQGPGALGGKVEMETGSIWKLEAKY